jgi:hypothetical protein
MDLEVSFVSVPALPRAALIAMSPLAQRLAHYRQQLCLPPPDGFVADGEPPRNSMIPLRSRSGSL